MKRAKQNCLLFICDCTRQIDAYEFSAVLWPYSQTFDEDCFMPLLAAQKAHMVDSSFHSLSCDLSVHEPRHFYVRGRKVISHMQCSPYLLVFLAWLMAAASRICFLQVNDLHSHFSTLENQLCTLLSRLISWKQWKLYLFNGNKFYYCTKVFRKNAQRLSHRREQWKHRNT